MTGREQRRRRWYAAAVRTGQTHFCEPRRASWRRQPISSADCRASPASTAKFEPSISPAWDLARKRRRSTNAIDATPRATEPAHLQHRLNIGPAEVVARARRVIRLSSRTARANTNSHRPPLAATRPRRQRQCPRNSRIPRRSKNLSKRRPVSRGPIQHRGSTVFAK